MTTYSIRALTGTDRAWVRRFVVEQWGAPVVVGHGQVYEPDTLPGFAAFDGDDAIGLLTCQIVAGACEVVTIDSLRSGAGVGSALIDAVADAARRAGCARLWLITTNDNLHALRFYQKRGFRIVAVHSGAVDRARQLKPEIPLLGNDGIPLRDEIELEMRLGGRTRSGGSAEAAEAQVEDGE